MAAEVGQAYVSIVPSLQGFSAKLKSQMAAELRGVDGPVQEAGKRAGASFGERLHEGIKSRLSGIATMLKTGLVIGAAAAAAGLAGLTTFGLKSAAALEQTQIGIEALVGSTQEATKFLGQLQTFAAATPFEFSGVADASRRILAFGQSVGIARNQVIPTLTTIGDLVSVLGGTQENVDSVIRALGQMASKGKLSQEEILQLAEALPGFNANAAIAAAVGKSVPETLKLITAGSIDAKTGINALLDGMAKFPGAAGAMAKQSQSLLGVFSTFKDTIGIALTNAFQPVIPAIKGALTELTPVLGQALNTLAPALGGVLSAILPLLGQLVGALVPILTPVLNILSGLIQSLAGADVLTSLGQAFGALLQPLVPLAPLIADIAAVLVQALIPVIAAFMPLVEALTPVLRELLLPFLPIVKDLAGLLASLLVPAVSFVAKVLEILAPILADVVTALGDLLRPIIKALAPIVGKLLQALEPLLPVISDLLGPIVDIVVAFTPLADVIAALLTAILPILEPFLNLDAMLISFLANKAIVPLIELLAKALTWLLSPLELLVQPLTDVATWLTKIDWAGVGKAIGSWFVDAWHHIADFFTNLWNWLTALPRQVHEKLLGLATAAVEAGVGMVRGLWQGISSMGGWLLDKIRSFIADHITNPVKNFLGIHSPSTVFAGMGEDSIAGYVQGLESSARQVSTATTTALAPAATTTATTAVAMPQQVNVTSDDAVVLAVMAKIAEQVRQRFGGDVNFALTTGTA